VQTPYSELQANCNLWRNWLDIQSSWQSLATIVEFWALASEKSQGFTEAAGPGSWNDPDMLIIGNEVGPPVLLARPKGVEVPVAEHSAASAILLHAILRGCSRACGMWSWPGVV
jgi:hypothetical protein